MLCHLRAEERGCGYEAKSGDIAYELYQKKSAIKAILCFIVSTYLRGIIDRRVGTDPRAKPRR